MELDSETVGNGEVSLVCYDPNWDKTDLDTMHIAYLNQYILENPASKLTKYKVMLTKKGQSSTVTITR